MKITDDMLHRAQGIDLVDYLTSQGYSLFHAGSSFKIKVDQKHPGDLSSLSVFSDRRGWKRWSDGSTGHDTISFLQKVCGKSFQEAVCELCGEIPHTEHVAADPEYQTAAGKALTLPKPVEGKYNRAYAYLTNTRCIEPAIVTAMMKAKKIYQDERGNVVFVGMDQNGAPRYGAFRGTITGKQYRGECTGSDKRYSFCMEGTNPEKLIVFESPIDAMSHATLVNAITGKLDAWKVHTRLSLGGTADTALLHYLSEHPKCRDITLCLDNDEAGLSAAKLIAQKLTGQGYAVKILPSKCKDFNEQLCALHDLSKRDVQETAKRGRG
ncbi:MAG: DUF3991 and TOPRIM domain-containing protein [Oscillospiraceae bacterium]|nr:DUF3991 and TOPRIM domain-containing protein [Oscillospiraceae bacterium]MBR3448403.1 DUF3991 and TOPRIM domain-containing protein [Oscillospiraceae bacterium]MBR4199984.1 DUF3991 and TOPRIM domain-containing protein [Oscillospiraceae bacterium]